MIIICYVLMVGCNQDNCKNVILKKVYYPANKKSKKKIHYLIEKGCNSDYVYTVFDKDSVKFFKVFYKTNKDGQILSTSVEEGSTPIIDIYSDTSKKMLLDTVKLYIQVFEAPNFMFPIVSIINQSHKIKRLDEYFYQFLDKDNLLLIYTYDYVIRNERDVLYISIKYSNPPVFHDIDTLYLKYDLVNKDLKIERK